MVGKRLAHYEVRERIGTGGMGEVYRALDTKLDRDIALKVLSPAVADSTERRKRFEREAKAVAALQHPNIVTLHSVEEDQGVLFLTMELVEGKTLSEAISRNGLPLDRFFEIAVPLTDAVAAAHAKGITHRDLKPANVMLDAAGRTKVLDFGLAKLLDSSPAGGGEATMADDSVTQEGRVLGTVAYMSPEQAEGKPVDHRTDVFSLGIILYEMITGRRPFEGDSNLSTLTALLRDDPAPVHEIKQNVPDQLGRIIQRCLVKDPERRYQSMADIRNELEALGSETASSTSVAAPKISGEITVSAPPRTPVFRVVVTFLVLAIGVLLAVQLLTRQFGLPDWVLPGAIILLLIGLPVLIAAALLQGPSRVRPGDGPPGGLRSLLTLNRAMLGGVMAFVILGVVVAGYMITRQLGIGPAASLVSAGMLAEKSEVIIADFENRTDDPLLGDALKEALTIDLSQSSAVRVVSSTRVQGALTRMEKAPDTPITSTLAREIAERDGIPAVVAGQIHPGGAGYSLSTRILTSTGELLAAFRENATGPDDFLPAVDRLSEKMREKIGESLITIRASTPLEGVTTRSLEALQNYSQAIRVNDLGDTERALELLEEAVALDSTFAMAHRKLGVLLNNSFRDRARAIAAATTAYRLRERLPHRERYLAEAYYYSTIHQDPARAASAYRKILDKDPEDTWALNNLAQNYGFMGDHARRVDLLTQVEEIEPSPMHIMNLAAALLSNGQLAESDSVLAASLEQYPDHSTTLSSAGLMHAARGRYEESEAATRHYRDVFKANKQIQAMTLAPLAAVHAITGRFQEADRLFRTQSDLFKAMDGDVRYFWGVRSRATYQIFVHDDPAEGVRILEEGIENVPLKSLPPMERGYLDNAAIYAQAGDVDRARMLLEEFDQAVDPQTRKRLEDERQWVLGEIALVENRPRDAVRIAHDLQTENPGDATEGWMLMARAYDAANQPDSALIAYEAYVNANSFFRMFEDTVALPHSLVRLGELHEARGERERALYYYSRFVELWKDADPDLLDRVRRVQGRINALASES